MSKPNRSDEHLPKEEENRIEEETREYFEGITPQRHTKPNRSEYSSSYKDQILPSDSNSIPELNKLQELESHPDKLECHNSHPSEEYVETGYYDDLNCVDRQHHKTGTGFIKVEKSDGSGWFKLESKDVDSGYNPSSKSNPATNDWIPSAKNVIPISDKPNRSDI